MAAAIQINALQKQLFLRNSVEDDVLAEFYLRMKDERLLHWLYYQTVPTLGEFLSSHRRTDLVYLAGYASKILDCSEPELCGMCWAESIQRLPGLSKAQVGMAYFREYQRDDTALELARMSVDFAFDTVRLDVLLGTTPVKNRAACIFTERVGFQRIGIAPDYVSFWGERSAAVLSVLTKDHWGKIQRGQA